MIKIFRWLPAMAVAVAVAGCSDNNKFEVEGNIADASDEPVMLERMNFQGVWISIDSTRTDDSGNYEMNFEAPAAPELFRLSLNGQHIYFPIDSLEHLRIDSKKNAFDREFTLSGSPLAEKMMKFEKEVQKIERLANADSTAAFRKRVFNNYLKDDKGSSLGYYALIRRMGDGFLIDYTDPIYTAVANQFHTYRPTDPRTAALVERAAQGQAERRRRAGQVRVIEAAETAIIDIDLTDKNGNHRLLSQLTGKGKPVVVAFGALSMEDAPAVNRVLKSLYDSGMADIYQVCVDPDQLAWKTAATPLPWTVVFDPSGTASRNLMAYNVGSLPKFFIYDRNGELHRESTTDVTRLSAILSAL